jgi:hypothetical protein
MMVHWRNPSPLLAATAMIFVTVPSVCLGQNASSSQVQPGESTPGSVAGCYELQLGRWWPWSLGEDGSFATPPAHIELSLERGKDGFEQNQLVIREIPLRTPSRRKSYWQPRSKHVVDLIWTDGFTGVTLRLTQQGNELRGWAHPHFDSGMLVPRVARVIARRTSCLP